MIWKRTEFPFQGSDMSESYQMSSLDLLGEYSRGGIARINFRPISSFQESIRAFPQVFPFDCGDHVGI